MEDDYLPAALSMLADDYRTQLEQEEAREVLNREMGFIRDEIELRIDGVDPQFLAYAKDRALALGRSLQEELFQMVIRVANHRHAIRLEIADKPVSQPFSGTSFSLPDPEHGTPEGELMILVNELNPERRFSHEAGIALLWLLSYFRKLGRPINPPKPGSN
jgi:hypothetical protein